MSILVNASLDMTLLVEMAHKGHSAFNVGKNGKTYVNVQMWVNDEADKFGDHASIQLNSTKEGAERDKTLNPPDKTGKPGARCYVGRGKKSDLTPKPLDQAAASALTLPGQQAQTSTDTQTQQAQQGATGWQQPATGLPF